MSRTLQFRRYNSATIANTTGANGELIINSTNHTITVHDGVTPGGYALPTFSDIGTSGVDQFARNTANSATSLAQSAYNYANTISATGIDQFARNTANTASNNITILQGVNNTQNTNITVATNLAQNAYNQANSKFSSSGGQITGNVIIVGDLDVTDNTIVSNAIEANNAIFDGTLLSGLAARTSVVLPHLIAQFASNSASYVQTNSQNINPNGSADWVVTADNGTDTDFYIDMGLHGSQAFDKVLTPYDGYLFVQGSTIGQAGGNLIIGTTSSFSGLETKFVAGGYNSNNVVMKLGTGGANVVGDLIVTGQIIGPTINAISGGGVTGNISVLATNSAINFVANSSGDGIGYSTIQLVPDTNATQDQYIVIDPTAPSHIHIRAGGVQDSSGAQLFLGGEKHYVRVTDNQGIRLQNEELSDNYYYYEQNNQYVSGIWYEESGNYFIQFTTDNGQMVNDLANFADGGSPNEVILYWNNGVETISNTMISVSGFWQGIGNVYTAQVSATLPANNTILTAIEFHLFTTRTNFLILENNDFTVDVTDDVRINARDYFSLRNWSTTDPIEIVTDYDNQSHVWEFGANGTLETPGDIIVSGDVTGRDGVNTLVLKAQPTSDTSIQLNDTVDSTISTSANLEIRTDVSNVPYVWTFENNGTITFPDASTQTGAAISIVELKALVANCATYGDFQTAIANL